MHLSSVSNSKSKKSISSRLIFLISLPRSGSTLLQQVLGTHQDIYTYSEPWLMLHPLQALNNEDITAKYDHNLSIGALKDILKTVPEGDKLYYQAVRAYGLTFYHRLLEIYGKRYFLDKTPRYYRVIHELSYTFPDAKFIILLRNPIAILSSVLKTWCNNDLSVLLRSSNYRDMTEGPKSLASGIHALGNNVSIVRYEDLVINPEESVAELCSYLKLDFSKEMLNYGSHRIPKSRYGDPVSIHKYDHPVKHSLDKWKNNLSTRDLLLFSRNYLDSIGEATFEELGYDYHKMITDLDLNKDNQICHDGNFPCEILEANSGDHSHELNSDTSKPLQIAPREPFLKNNIPTPVIIYQMGKVGSTSVMHSLNRIGIPNQHVHRLSWSGIKKAEERILKSGVKKLPERFQQYRKFRSYIDSHMNDVRWKIITLVRDPLARQISCIFQNLGVILPKIGLMKFDSQKCSLIDDYLNKYLTTFNEYEDDGCQWFDNELKHVFGFDIFSVPFDKELAYSIYQTENADILVMRVEQLSDRAAEAIKQHLGINNFELANTNFGKDKPYSHLYKQFLDQFNAPKELLDRFYNTRLANHFYTPDEIRKFKQRWLPKTCAETHVKSVNHFRVSAVISTYASERFIEGRLQNLIGQTLFKQKELEIIVVDSNSPENEKSIVECFSAQHPNIRYLRTSERETVYAAWNRGIEMSLGTYFVNANTDDRFAPDALELMADALDSHPDFGAAYGNWVVTRTPNDTFDSSTPKRLFIYPEFHPGLFFYLQITSHANFVRRSVIDEIGPFDGAYTVFGDREFMFRFSASGFKALKLDKTIGLYLENPTSVERANRDIGKKECVALYDAYLTPGRFAALMGYDIDIPPETLSAAYTESGCFGMGLYQINGRPVHALGSPARLFAKAIELDQGNVEALNNLGVIAQHRQAHKNALQFFENAKLLSNDAQTKIIDHNKKMVRRGITKPDQLQFLFPSDFNAIRVVECSYNSVSQNSILTNNKLATSNKKKPGRKRKLRKKSDKKNLSAPKSKKPASLSAPTGVPSVDDKIWPAWADYLMEDYSSALASLHQHLVDDPDFWEAYELLVDILQQCGQEEEIVERLHLLENRQGLPAGMLALVGSGYEAVGDLERAVSFADQALAIASDCARAWDLKGVVAYKKRNLPEAATCFQKASEYAPAWGDPWTNMGTIHWEQGTYDKALECYEVGFRLSPTAPNVATTYHVAISESGQFDRAKPHFEDVVARHPDFRRARFLLIDILIRLEAYPAALNQIEAVLLRFGIDPQLLAAAKAIRAKVGPMSIQNGRHPSLSLCMIVKNEEKYLAHCLKSLKPMVDEMIIVDTGSTDTTRDIAKVFGAKVFDYEWKDDFAAARNKSLEQAQGDWILVMDADEVIAPSDQNAIRKLIQKSQNDKVAYVMTTRNYTDRKDSAEYTENAGQYKEEMSTGWVPSKKVRLFHNHRVIKFVYPVHELVDPVLKELGIPVIDCPFPVHHYGKLDQARTSERWQMYYDIGHKKLASQHDNDHALKELAIQAGLLSKWEEAAAHWEAFLHRNPDSIDACLNLTRIMAKCGDFQHANHYANKAFQLADHRSETIYNLALSELQTGHAVKAVQTTNRLVDNFPDDPDGRLLNAIAQICAGKLDEGRKRLNELSQTVSMESLLPRIRSISQSILSAGFDGWVEILMNEFSKIEKFKNMTPQPTTRAPKKSAVAEKTTLAVDEKVSTLFAEALQHYEREDYQFAFDILLHIIAAEPNHSKAYELLVDVVLQSGQNTDISDQLCSLENRADLPACMMALVGQIYEASGNLEKAVVFADQALSSDATCARAWNLKGVIAYQNGNNSEAAQLFQKASECDGKWGDPWTNMGTLHWENGTHDKALECFETGFRLSPTAPNVANTYHMAITETGGYDRAKTIFEEAVTQHPDFRKARFLLIDILIRLEAYKAALDHIDDVIVRFGEDPQLIEAAKVIRAKLGPLAIKKGKRPSLSLCMIVKNEAQFLPRCLASLKPVVDEMIIVDTGSEDATRDIAEIFGAKVFDYEWNDDFAAARNHSLEKASGDWILVMDADETIASKDHHKIRKLIKKSQKGKVAYTITTRNYTHNYNSIDWKPNDARYADEEAGCGWIPSTKTRLFVNSPQIRFDYPVHELVDPALVRNGYKIRQCNVPVHHYGILEKAKASQKGSYYYEIGKRKLQQMENDPNAIHELAVAASNNGNQHDAIMLWNRVAELQPNNVRTFINLSAVYSKLGDYNKAKSSALRAVKIDPETKEGHYNLGRSEFFLGNFIEARKIFENIVRNYKTYYSAHFMLGATRICCGNSEEGLAIFLKFKPLIVWSSLPHAFEELAKALSQAGLEPQAKNLIRFIDNLDITQRRTSCHSHNAVDNQLIGSSENKLSMAS